MTDAPTADPLRTFHDAVAANADILGAGWIRDLGFDAFADAGLDSRAYPLAFFDQDYYRSQLPEAWNGEANLYLHFCRLGGRLGLKPNPIVDFGFLQRQLAELDAGGFRPAGQRARPPRDNVDLLAQYLRRIGDRNLSPHPLFDPSLYAVSADLAETDIPVLHFLAHGSDTAFSPYFSVEFYELQVPELRGSTINRLGHYCDAAPDERCDANPMLSGAYYRAAVGNPAVDPLSHFVTDGADLGLRPNPYTDADFAAGGLDAEWLGIGTALRRYIAVA